MSRAVWSEFVPYSTLRHPAVRHVLATRGIGIHVAVTPSSGDDLGRTLAVLRDDGLRVTLWPMLADAEGRWPSARNAAAFKGFVVDTLDRLPRLPHAVAIDLEPPYDELLGLLRLDPRAIAARWRSHHRHLQAVQTFTALCHELRDRELEVLAVAFPLILEDSATAGWQRFLGTPVDDLPARFNAMIYTSLIEGYGRGLCRRDDALGLLSWWCGRARQRFGNEASVSLGCVGRGALGDEPTYRDHRELAEDVAIAQATGVDDLVLFSLGGVLARPPVEAWLDAFIETPAASAEPPALTARGRALTRTLRLGARGLGRLADLTRGA
ncbi:MAG: hypothetical protein AAF928_11905 [Myxococcota bacterium]